jgi:hypothetical protein
MDATKDALDEASDYGSSNGDDGSSNIGDHSKSLGGMNTSSTSTSSGPTEEEAKLDLAKKETTAVFRLRLLVLLVLLLTTVGVSLTMYFITFNGQQGDFEAAFEGSAQKILETFLDIATSRLGTVASLGVSMTAYAIDQKEEWPFVTLSKFQRRAATARSQSGAVYLHTNPLVTDTTRTEWEKYVVGNASYWM